MLIRSDHATALSETNFPEISAIPKLIKMRHTSRDALMDQKLHKIEFFFHFRTTQIRRARENPSV